VNTSQEVHWEIILWPLNKSMPDEAIGDLSMIPKVRLSSTDFAFIYYNMYIRLWLLNSSQIFCGRCSKISYGHFVVVKFQTKLWWLFDEDQRF
jgi:hypothetical protein